MMARWAEMKPHFKARWHFHFSNEKPRSKVFYFPESGFRRLPLEFTGTASGLNTVGITGPAASAIKAGSVVTLDCTTISYAQLQKYIRLDAEVTLWDGDYFATGSIIEVYPPD